MFNYPDIAKDYNHLMKPYITPKQSEIRCGTIVYLGLNNCTIFLQKKMETIQIAQRKRKKKEDDYLPSD